MRSSVTVRIRRISNLVPCIALMGVWLAGLSLGLLADRFYGDCFGSLVFPAGEALLSFGNACMVTILPLLLSAFAVLFFHCCGAFAAAFLRGVSLGFFLGLLMDAGGVWLAVLLPFSGLFFCPVLLWYLWRRLLMGLRDARRDFCDCLLVGLFLAAVDTWVVAPFLAAALTF